MRHFGWLPGTVFCVTFPLFIVSLVLFPSWMANPAGVTAGSLVIGLALVGATRVAKDLNAVASAGPRAAADFPAERAGSAQGQG